MACPSPGFTPPNYSNTPTVPSTSQGGGHDRGASGGWHSIGWVRRNGAVELRWLAVTGAVFATASQHRDRKCGVTCVQVDCTAVFTRYHSPFGDTALAITIRPPVGHIRPVPLFPCTASSFVFLLPPRNKASTMQRTTHPSIHRNEKSETHTQKKSIRQDME